jgi:hypothetical protein
MVALGAGMAVGVLRSEEPITIQAVLEQPVLDESVYLEGTVGDHVPLVEARVYELQDETGSIWVLTTAAEPQSGTQIEIQGIVRYLGDGDPLTQPELLYIEEETRL